MHIPFLTRAFERGSNRRHLDESANSRLAKDFGVAAEHEQSFAITRSRLRLAGDFGAAGIGLATLVGTGSIFPAAALTIGATALSRKAINAYLPSFFQKQNGPKPSP